MSPKNQTISFVLDGIINEIDFDTSQLRPTHTLLHYLRSLPNHKGTKEGCGEGDCGACTVVLGEYVNGVFSYKAVDSCLVFLPMIHGKQVITIENLAVEKNRKTILHPIQQYIIEENGTQCGFCTPGFVMAIFALYKNEKNPKTVLIKNALSGNLCRCTGYNSILKATQKACKENKDDHFTKHEKNIISLLTKINCSKTIELRSKEQVYFKAFNLAETIRLKNLYPDSLIVSGSTDCGLRVTKKHEILPLIIDISDVEELKTIKKNQTEWLIGAAVKLENVRLNIQKDLKALYDMLTVFGSKQVRNMATLGGNVGSASPIGDTLPLLLAYNASVELQSVKGIRIFKLSDFIVDYRKTQILPDEIITSIIIPKPDKETIVKSYKISKRKDLDISTVSACFSLKLKKDKIESVILAFGGMSAFTKRAANAEKFLINKIWSEKTIRDASKLIEKDFSPISDARAGKEMRMIAAKNLLMKFWLDTIDK